MEALLSRKYFHMRKAVLILFKNTSCKSVLPKWYACSAVLCCPPVTMLAPSTIIPTGLCDECDWCDRVEVMEPRGVFRVEKLGEIAIGECCCCCCCDMAASHATPGSFPTGCCGGGGNWNMLPPEAAEGVRRLLAAGEETIWSEAEGDGGAAAPPKSWKHEVAADEPAM